MHPMERLRHLARASGADPVAVVREAASALRGLGDDPAGLVVACRRLVEKHPTCGPLWWLCAHIVTAAEPYAVARRLAGELQADTTCDVLAGTLPAAARVCVVGWPDIAAEAIAARGDVTVLAVEVDEATPSFVRQLSRDGVMAESVVAPSLGAAVLVSDVVVIEALAAADGQVLAVVGSRAAASVAHCSGVPVLAVVGRGRCLPVAAFESVVARLSAVEAPWEVPVDVVPLALCDEVVRPHGVVPAAEVSLNAECPSAPELLRHAPN